jgi:hypothetical protein
MPIQVQMETFAKICSSLEHIKINLIKMDIEGFEY